MSTPFLPTGDQLASEFAQLINAQGKQAPLGNRRPSPMLPPTAVVTAQMEALQMNDWPDADSGTHTAFLFSMPPECDSILPGQVRSSDVHLAASHMGVPPYPYVSIIIELTGFLRVLLFITASNEML